MAGARKTLPSRTPGVTGRKNKQTPAALLAAPGFKVKRRILRDGARSNELRDDAFRRIVLSIPAGKVSTYGRVAAAAGYPLDHRAVARLLRTDPPDKLPWHRVVGAGGEVKLRGDAAREQGARLKMEGVRFNGKRVDMSCCEYSPRNWDTLSWASPDDN